MLPVLWKDGTDVVTRACKEVLAVSAALLNTACAAGCYLSSTSFTWALQKHPL